MRFAPIYNLILKLHWITFVRSLKIFGVQLGSEGRALRSSVSDTGDEVFMKCVRNQQALAVSILKFIHRIPETNLLLSMEIVVHPHNILKSLEYRASYFRPRASYFRIRWDKRGSREARSREGRDLHSRKSDSTRRTLIRGFESGMAQDASRCFEGKEHQRRRNRKLLEKGYFKNKVLDCIGPMRRL